MLFEEGVFKVNGEEDFIIKHVNRDALEYFFGSTRSYTKEDLNKLKDRIDKVKHFGAYETGFMIGSIDRWIDKHGEKLTIGYDGVRPTF